MINIKQKQFTKFLWLKKQMGTAAAVAEKAGEMLKYVIFYIQ